MLLLHLSREVLPPGLLCPAVPGQGEGTAGATASVARLHRRRSPRQPQALLHFYPPLGLCPSHPAKESELAGPGPLLAGLCVSASAPLAPSRLGTWDTAPRGTLGVLLRSPTQSPGKRRQVAALGYVLPSGPAGSSPAAAAAAHAAAPISPARGRRWKPSPVQLGDQARRRQQRLCCRGSGKLGLLEKGSSLLQPLLR